MAPVRALIVDDSPSVRRVIRTLLERDPEIDVVGEAGDPYQARNAIKALDPDVLTLDVEMPRMDGLEFLGHLMRLRPMPVVMVSSQTGRGGAAAVRALSIGAIDCVDRSEINADLAGGSRLRTAVRTAASARTRSRRGHVPAAPVDFTPNGKLLLLGSSTGGVDALETIFAEFPAHCPPTLVAQHMPPAFLASFAERLDKGMKPTVRLAEDGDAVRNGTILIAPGGPFHLTLGPGGRTVRLLRDDGAHLYVPSVDVLFGSAVPSARDVVAAILTGMGRDGADALLRLRQAGSCTIAQSGRTAVVDGMPRAARGLGAATHVIDLEDIARRVLAACGRPEAAA